jgi:glucan phosphoethanolaminetransferase (alkaline phosphatase superfamily)
MKTKIEQLLWLLLAAAFTGFMIYFVKDGGVVTAISAAFTSIVGIFIGVDITAMIKKTSVMPIGEYQKINKHRYIAALIIFAALIVEAFVISGVYGRDCDGLYASFGMGFLVVTGGLVAGVEGNKIFTGKTSVDGSLF